MERFYLLEIGHVARGENAQADAFAKLASSLAVPPDGSLHIQVINQRQMPSMIEEEP